MEKLKPSEFHPSMRGHFAGCLYNEMTTNDGIVVLTCDLGYGMFDKIRDDFPRRFYNVGAAEQAAVGIATGMALKDKIPVVYSITPFVLYRPYEWIRNYLSHEEIPVKLVGSGRDFDYSHDGWTHHCPDAKQVLKTLPKVAQFWPDTNEDMRTHLKTMLNNGRPSFMSLKR